LYRYTTDPTDNKGDAHVSWEGKQRRDDRQKLEDAVNMYDALNTMQCANLKVLEASNSIKDLTELMSASPPHSTKG
jgi:hypothetical protein